jgi:hypothetical protein
VKLTIDNLDGRGPVDYSAAVDRSSPKQPLVIARTLNAPSIAHGMLCLSGSALVPPVRQARVVLASDTGTTLFTGYLATEPEPVYAGAATEGPVYRLAFSAVSDEWLLDKQSKGALAAGGAGASLNSFAGDLLSGLAQRLGAGSLTTGLSPQGIAAGRQVGAFEAPAAAAWSGQAGAAAATTYGAYRAVGGTLTLVPVGSVVHTLSDGDGSLSVSALRTSAVRELANDVTVSGAIEPSVYWTELFLGDGTTADFSLLGEPTAPTAGHATLIDDTFSAGPLNLTTWTLVDPGSHIGLGAGGLVLNGGNGFDGQTTLTAWDRLELGGTIVLELANVALNPGSAGVLGGLYQGVTLQANCLAGFGISQSGGNTVVQPIVNGLATGTAFSMLSGHLYTLRLHLHSPETLRIRQAFYASVNGVVERFGDGFVDAPLSLVFEIRDLGSSSNTPVTVLYDGAMASSPIQASVVAANSTQLFGSVGAVRLRRTGSAWIVTADPTTGTPGTRLAGNSTDGVDCRFVASPTTRLSFFPGRIPPPNEPIQVRYRGRRRAVARLENATSVVKEAAGGGLGTARWLGKVLRPTARSSEDCENAAQAILTFASNRAAAVTGSYIAVNPPAADIWPGDVLALTANGSVSNVIVRKVAIDEAGAAPEALTYRIDFANDWAEGLGLTLSEAISPDARIPPNALSLTPRTAAPVLANLQQMTVVASTSALTLDAGLDPPPDGGFEVRRHNGGFGTGIGATAAGDLVLRSPVRGFSIPRAAFEETFFVRMFDASNPPLYSRESAAILTHLPIG